MSDDTDPVVCVCRAVSEAEILAAVKSGCRGLAAVREETGANTGCGDCAADIEELLDLVGRPGQAVPR
ncbi:(2Fe-2S)-binding protein [Streptomyces angustmyceticus]|uniref:(2Fe-2S)-binding protein n=1 Tax=Streptomyces angustmyceticus TaxID=285578 RepID=UPI00344C094C